MNCCYSLYLAARSEFKFAMSFVWGGFLRLFRSFRVSPLPLSFTLANRGFFFYFYRLSQSKAIEGKTTNRGKWKNWWALSNFPIILCRTLTTNSMITFLDYCIWLNKNIGQAIYKALHSTICEYLRETEAKGITNFLFSLSLCKLCIFFCCFYGHENDFFGLFSDFINRRLRRLDIDSNKMIDSEANSVSIWVSSRLCKMSI